MNKTIFEVLPALDIQLQAAVTELVETLSHPYGKYSNYVTLTFNRAKLLVNSSFASSGFVYYLYEQLNSGISKEAIIKRIITLLHRYHGSVQQPDEHLSLLMLE